MVIGYFHTLLAAYLLGFILYHLFNSFPTQIIFRLPLTKGQHAFFQFHSDWTQTLHFQGSKGYYLGEGLILTPKMGLKQPISMYFSEIWPIFDQFIGPQGQASGSSPIRIVKNGFLISNPENALFLHALFFYSVLVGRVVTYHIHMVWAFFLHISVNIHPK